ncbi:glutathione S-transferase [Thalassomonas viridans]|uniref:Glutathione S-transferase n=1 Tax=Thalassomonas viridans TaxID=137584 RepID=A0AAE9Z7E5_9GAMM|nr:glutathione S-transferase [Thalassomonas viridans]WDE07415.1 glutathione S-transferase [Thalassomonas viridans]
MLTLHHLENSQSIRVLWLLEELGAEYKILHFKRDAATSLAPEDFKKLHITGTSPCISDGELVLPETNAILDYIMDKYGDKGLRPAAGDPDRAQYLYWFHAAQGSFMPLLLDALIFKRMSAKTPFFIRPVIRFVVNKVRENYLVPRLERLLSHIETTLAANTWFAGDKFTAADIVMGYCMDVAAVRVGMDDSYPNAQRFLRQMRQRPGFIAAMKKNGDFKPFAE